MEKIKIAVAVTGASGAIYAQLLLERLLHLQDQVQELGLCWSANAGVVWQEELDTPRDRFLHSGDFLKLWQPDDFYAPVASGSAAYSALIICPCSMGTLGRIAAGISNDLITRAADVMLKERRRLVCVVRETPYNLVQLRNMATVTEAGGIICPASPSFYSKPQTTREAADTVVVRVLQLCGLTVPAFRWGKNPAE
jgi:4-hydroxy-3-polyprenylbenzoate decarboxylase